MQRTPTIVFPKDYPRALQVVGERITVLASGAATGAQEFFLQEGPEGSGPPPHSHPWDEAFYVVKGEVAFGVGPDELVAGAGTMVHLPAGTTHWFRFGRGGGQMVSITNQGRASQMFATIDRDIAPDMPDFPKLVGIAMQHGLSVAVPA